MAVKVNELAKELGKTNEEIMAAANKLGISARTTNSSIEENDVQAIRNSFGEAGKAAPARPAGNETKIVKAAPGVTKAAPGATKAAPGATKAAPGATKAAPGATKAAPGATKAAPGATKAAPGATKAAPGATKAAPAGSAIAGARRPAPKAVEPEKEEAPAEEPRVMTSSDAKAAASLNLGAARRIKKENVKPREPKKEEPAPAPAEPAAPVSEKQPEPAPQPAEKPAEAPAPKEVKAAPAAKEKAPAAEEKPAAKEEPAPKAEAPAAKPAPEKKPAPKKPMHDDGRQKLKIIRKASDKDKQQAARPAKPRNNAGSGQKSASGQKPAGQERRRPADRPAGGPGAAGRGGQNAAPAKGNDKRKKKNDNRDNDRYGKFDRQGGANYPKSLEKKAKKKHVKQRPEPEPQVEEEILPIGTKVVNVPITIAGFCEQVGVTVASVIMTLLKMGMIANQNQNIDEVTVTALADEMGLDIVIGKVEEEEEEEGLENFEDREKDLQPRAPIITVMGHVDHGKTSLLDAIRNTNVTAGESGGITQHIGASEVTINGQKIVFLDTPGHEAFTAMRARGADITDIAVLVVAADDSVKPQTIESISHAKAAGVPIIVAINKMDKPGANPDMVKKDLADHGVLVEEWGGDVICVPVSAKTGDGIVNLLEMILLQAEVLELKANPNRLALGTVIEARLDKSKGPVATLLVANGTLRAGQSVVAGTCAGRIRLMTNYKGEKIHKAGPATAVEILGLNDVPAAGDKFNAVGDDHLAKEIAEKRKQKQREEIMARKSGMTLEELFSSAAEGEVKELNLIVKGDVMGSVGAVVSSLEKLSNEEVKVKIVHQGVGAINESDVILAGTAGAVIIGFNVRPSSAVQAAADRESVQIRTYRVIYDIIDDVEAAMKGMLDPEFKEEVLGEIDVRDTFKVPGVGIIAGGYVMKGKIVRNASARLVREGIVIHEGNISSLKRFKDDAKEVAQGFECGIGLENYNDIKVGDVIECYHMVEVERDA